MKHVSFLRLSFAEAVDRNLRVVRMRVTKEPSQDFFPKYLFTNTLTECFEGNILRKIITVRGSDNIDDSVPHVMHVHHNDVDDKDPFVRYGDNSILICLQYNFSNTRRTDKKYYFSASEDKFSQVKLCQKIANKPPTEIKIEKPFKVSIHEVVSKNQDRISHCIEISGNMDITEKFRVYRPDDTISDDFVTTTERVFISSNKLRIHSEALVNKFCEDGLFHNRITDLSSFLQDGQSPSFHEHYDELKLSQSLLNLEDAVQHTPLSSKYQSACSKTGTPEHLNSETCDSITPASTKSSLLSVKSRPGTPFIKKKRFLSKSSVVPTLPDTGSSADGGKTFLFTNSSAVKALREGSLFGKSTGFKN
ncbi:unnamed protein product [Auanema sp. JU1783]|nr:unnamed protein product [Auanema sp. JU1783]